MPEVVIPEVTSKRSPVPENSLAQGALFLQPLRLFAGTVLSVLKSLHSLHSLHGSLASLPVSLLEPRHSPLLLLLVVKVLPAENISLKYLVSLLKNISTCPAPARHH